MPLALPSLLMRREDRLGQGRRGEQAISRERPENDPLRLLAALAAGDLMLYPSTSLHRVEPVTRSSRVAAFFWIESRIRDDAQRTILLDMDAAIRSLAQSLGDDRPEVFSLTGCYHNLLRRRATG